MKEKLADGEIPDEEQETLDEINHKKVSRELHRHRFVDVRINTFNCFKRMVALKLKFQELTRNVVDFQHTVRI